MTRRPVPPPLPPLPRLPPPLPLKPTARAADLNTRIETESYTWPQRFLLLIPLGCGGGILTIILASCGIGPLAPRAPMAPDNSTVGVVDGDVASEAEVAWDPLRNHGEDTTSGLDDSQMSDVSNDEEAVAALAPSTNHEATDNASADSEAVAAAMNFAQAQAEWEYQQRQRQIALQQAQQFEARSRMYELQSQHLHQQAHHQAQQHADRFMQDYRNSMSGQAGAMGISGW